MIDLSRIEAYRENNRIEAKKALGGLPHSIWETYSAFANTLGGVILLGVEEHRDHTLHPVNLPDPAGMAEEFWDILNDPQRVSVNILTRENLRVETVDGGRLLVITVPRAQRYDRPVYVGGNPISGTYRRSGEGDYRCSPEEVRSMLRDAAVRTQDMQLLPQMGPEVLDPDSIRRYRARMRDCRPGHVWETLEDAAFLEQLGAAGRDKDGTLHPTAGGLLMFGYEAEIVREFPLYFLDYREQLGDDARWTDRIASAAGEWSGNLYDFYFLVCDQMSAGLPFHGAGGVQIRSALREALANTLINADYYGRQGVVVIRRRDRISFSNPGAFRIRIEAARSGGVSDPRNAALSRMFSLVSVGARSGSGIPNIYAVWKRQGLAPPSISEHFAPERTTLTLPLQAAGSPRGGRGGAPHAGRQVVRQLIIEYLTDHPCAKTSDIAADIGRTPAGTRACLRELMAEGIVTARGGGRSRVYALKA